MSFKIAIIGGGISGLTCVFRLSELKKHASDLEVTIFESSSRFGGTIQTETHNQFLIEKGPDSFLNETPFVVNLCHRLGIEPDLISTNSGSRSSFIVKNDQLMVVPSGFYMIAPTEWKSFVKSPLFSWPAKIRMAAEYFLPARRNAEDESVGHFIRRRFGKEALERAGQPMLAGIYTADPDTLSLDATMPRFKNYEQEEGSVIRGMMKKNKEARSASGPRYSLFLSFKQGMQHLTDSLCKKIPAEWLKNNVLVQTIYFDPLSNQWILKTNAADEKFDAVILAVSAKQASRLLQSNETLSTMLNQLHYHSVATLNVGFQSDQIKNSLNGFGFVVPEIEKKSLIACSFSSVKFEGRAPKETVLLRAFIGGAFGVDVFNQKDDELKSNVLADLKTLLQINGEPLFSNLSRFPNTMVEYRVGHLNWLEKVRHECAELSHFELIGSSYHGVGIAHCVKEAESAAERLVWQLRVKSSVLQ